MTVEKIARVCHEANRAYCQTLGDYSQKSWDHAPDWQKQSAIKGVEFRLRHPKSTPADSHGEWLEQKAQDGWVYGEKKDAVAKTHPCIRPYVELPEEQQLKDSLFLAVVDSLKGE